MKTNVLFSHRSLSHLCALLLCAFAMVSNAWATEVSSTFTKSDGTVGTGEPAWTVTGATSFESSGSARGIAWNKKAGTLTNTSLSSYTITKIVVVASSNETGTLSSMSVTVGGKTFGETQSIAKSNLDSYTFEGSASGTIVISTTAGTNKTYWIKSITVTYTSGGGSGTVSVTGVALDKTSLDLTVGGTATLTATVSPSNATTKTVTWKSSDTSVATVSDAGLVTAKAAGTATITVTTTDGSKTATCTVTVKAAGGGGGSEGDCGVFHETWDKTSGKGANDGSWSGSIAQGSISADNTGWTYTKGNGADACLKVGNSSNAGVATTPEISVTSGNTYSLSFKAGSWSGDDTGLTLSAVGATLDKTSFTMGSAAWEELSTTFTATSSTVEITFTAAKRMFLDDVCISEATSCDDPTKALALTATKTSITTDESSTVSVTSGTGNGETVTYAITSDNSATGSITAAGVFTATAAGTYTIKATQPSTTGDPCTKGGTATINITVTAAPITVNIYENGTKNTDKSVTNHTPPFTLPTADDACEEWTFVGWYNTTLAKTETCPTLLNVGTEINASGDYYAVYKNSEGGDETTFNIADIATTEGWTNGTQYGSYTIDPYTITYTGGDNDGKYYTSDNTWRLYKNGTITITASGDAAITSVTTNPALSFTISGNTATYSETSTTRAIKSFVIGGGTTYYSTTAVCGPKVKTDNKDYYVTSTKDQRVRLQIPVTAERFTAAMGASFKVQIGDGFIDPDNYTFANGGTIGEGTTNDILIVEYNPNDYGTAGSGTVACTLTDTKDQSAAVTFKIHCRSLPNQFVIVANSNDKWYALRADMQNANSHAGSEVTPNEERTEVTAAPEYALYFLQETPASRSAEDNYLQLVRFGAVADDTQFLWGSNTTTTIKDDKPTAGEMAQYEWQLTTTDNLQYKLSLPANPTADRAITYRSGNSAFGLYSKSQGQQTLYFMEVGCDRQPADLKVDGITSKSAIFTWKGSDISHTLVLNDGETDKTYTNVTSPYTVSDLQANTDYTYTLTPDGYTACAVSGSLHTEKAPITITLHRHGKDDETITDIPEAQQPYTLPAVANPCDEWQYVGWATSAIDVTTKQTSYTNITEADANGDYYAVYKGSDDSGSGTTGTLSLSTPGGSSGYNTAYSKTEYTSDNDAITVESNNILNSTTVIQLKKGTSNILWNSDALPNGITKIELTVTQGTPYVYVGNSALSSVDTDDALTVTSTSGSTYTYEITGNYKYFAIGASSSAVIMSYAVITYGTSSTTIYATNPSCTPCTEAGAEFMYQTVSKTTVSKPFTNAVVFTLKTNTSAQKYTSSDTDVATVNATTGEVTIVGKGTTTITLTFGRDDTDLEHPVCGDIIAYELEVTDPVVEVVGVTDKDEIVVEHDFEGITTATLEEAITGVEGNIADDIFISKYYEAASNMKLFALYNGTEHYIDLSQLRVRSNYTRKVDGVNTIVWPEKGELGYLEFGTISKLGDDYPSYLLPPFTEVTFWSNNYGTGSAATYNATLRGCIKMEINGKEYTIDDMEAGTVPNWYCIGDYVTYNTKDADNNEQLVFNGDDAIILERTEDGGTTWTPIDLFGSGTADAPVVATGTGNGYIQTVSGVNDSPGGYYWDATSSAGTALSTNRFYLMRNKDVKSGLAAVEGNKTYFQTLGTEWHGKGTGTSGDAYCTSGEYFSEVAQYDYSNYYTEYQTVTDEKWKATDNGDGTMNIWIKEGLDNYACKYLRITVTSADDTKAKIEYKVPIIITEPTDITNSTLFSQHTESACQTCDVAILDGGVLTKSATGSTGDRPWVHNVDVYAGGELYIPKNTEYTVNTLTIRSEGDKVGVVDNQGTLNRLNTTLIHSKRFHNEGDDWRYYYFALPYDCNVADITFSNGDPAVLGKDFFIDWYDGEQRSKTQQGGNWKSIAVHPTHPNVIKAGYGYTIAAEDLGNGHKYVSLLFPMANFTEQGSNLAIPVGNWGAGNDEVRANHKGWNLVGNPFLTRYTAQEDLSSTVELRTGKFSYDSKTGYWSQDNTSDINYTVTPLKGGKEGYKEEELTDTNLDPFKCYIIQVGGDTEQSDITVQFLINQKDKRNIVRRAASEVDETTPVKLAVTLTNTQGEQDRTTLILSDDYTNAYDINHDLAKWRGSQYRRLTIPVLATVLSGDELAFNAVPDQTAANGIPVTYYTAKAGEMTFRLSDKYDWTALSEVLLFDATENLYHNLLTDGDYTFTSKAGEISNRFTLYATVNRQKSPAIVTSLDEATDRRIIAQDGRLIIHSQDITAATAYDMSGKVVASTTAHNNVVQLTVPQTGLYNIRLTTTNGNETLRVIVK